jgi:hypothetical protein
MDGWRKGGLIREWLARASLLVTTFAGSSAERVGGLSTCMHRALYKLRYMVHTHAPTRQHTSPVLKRAYDLKNPYL